MTVGPSTEAERGAAHHRPPECRRAQDAKRDVQVALSPSARRQPLCPGAPPSGV